jgi:hypothetical protein
MLQSQLKFRLKALGLHLIASATALAIIVGGLYLGWYRWPGWYLADVVQVTRIVILVDLVVGPLLTMVVANPIKPGRTLVRDVSAIALVQLIALGYGSVQMWNGRPLYYAFSEDVLQLVQAYDISSEQAEAGRKSNPDLAPHWYSLPRQVWAPLPADADESAKIVAAVVAGGDDIIDMPSRYKPWADGIPSLRNQLKKIDDVKYFSGNDKKSLKAQMQRRGLSLDQPNAIAMTGRARPLLVIVNPASGKFTDILSID